MPNLAGLHAALPTPFTADGSAIAEDAFADLVRRNIAAGLDGLYVGGSTGESFLLSPQERAHSYKVVAAAAAGDCTLIAHVGDINPAVAKELARAAADAGYHSVSAVPPFYFGYTFAELKAYYRDLAAETGLPFLIYNIPKLTGVTLTTAQIVELLELPHVAGVKNTASDYYALEQIRRAAPDTILLNGFDETLLAGYAMGAHGGIGSTYNIQAEKIIGVRDAVRAGDMARAQTLQGEINGLIDALVAAGIFPAIKYILELQGVAAGPCRAPFQPLSAEARRALDQTADTYLSQPARAAARAG
ncbi:MAG: N-acetylneuraminate lyase [Acuticoccus sp.]